MELTGSHLSKENNNFYRCNNEYKVKEEIKKELNKALYQATTEHISVQTNIDLFQLIFKFQFQLNWN